MADQRGEVASGAVFGHHHYKECNRTEVKRNLDQHKRVVPRLTQALGPLGLA